MVVLCRTMANGFWNCITLSGTCMPHKHIYIYLESPMTLVNLPFQEKEVFERKHSFLHMSRNVPFCVCPGRSSLDSVLRPFFGVQNASFCVQKASLSVRAGRVRMKIHSAPFFESSSLKTRFSSKNAKIY